LHAETSLSSAHRGRRANLFRGAAPASSVFGAAGPVRVLVAQDRLPLLLAQIPSAPGNGPGKSFPMIGKFFSNGWKNLSGFSNDWKKFSAVFQ
jgi:hypothetical protein